MYKFPSIEQYRNVIKRVKDMARFSGRDETGAPIFDPTKPVPTLRFEGTVKLHGTNAGIVASADTPDKLQFQSRERVLTLEQDNAGFMATFEPHTNDLLPVFHGVLANVDLTDAKAVAIYGEWCGGNIQKGVAIAGLPKMFVIFGAKAIFEDRETWLDVRAASYDISVVRENTGLRIYSIWEFPTYNVVIDFANPELAQAEMVRITEEVEACCPVGKKFGINGIGEGVVWRAVDPNWNTSDTWFKVKGEKHSASKVKTLAPVDVEAAMALKDFVESAVTEARLEQGIHVMKTEMLKELDVKNTGDFLRWVVNDILKEEADTIAAGTFDAKKVGGAISAVARPWYMKRIMSDET